MLIRMCLYPVDKVELIHIGMSIVNVTFIISVCLATGSYAWTYLPIDLQEFLNALIHVFFCSDILYTLSVLFLARSTMKNVFERLSDIYNASKSLQA